MKCDFYRVKGDRRYATDNDFKYRFSMILTLAKKPDLRSLYTLTQKALYGENESDWTKKKENMMGQLLCDCGTKIRTE